VTDGIYSNVVDANSTKPSDLEKLAVCTDAAIITSEMLLQKQIQAQTRSMDTSINKWGPVLGLPGFETPPPSQPPPASPTF